MTNVMATQRPLYEIKANLFKGLAHPLRVRILEVLSSAETVSVSDLLDETGLEASHLSQHLAVLRRHNLVLADRRASQMFYRLAYPDVAELLAVARILLVKILESTQEQLLSTVGLQEFGRQDGPAI
jgi:DNA-binding transcriptional ArsR family regulator